MSTTVDPKWKDIGVSLRNKNLYIKMPRSTAVTLWNNILRCDVEYKCVEVTEFLKAESDKSFGHSIFLCLSTALARKDIDTLSLISDEVVTVYRQALLAGLDSHPSVDWIARVGGPGNEGNHERLGVPVSAWAR